MRNSCQASDNHERRYAANSKTQRDLSRRRLKSLMKVLLFIALLSLLLPLSYSYPFIKATIYIKKQHVKDFPRLETTFFRESTEGKFIRM